jgi:hypothetical protein
MLLIDFHLRRYPIGQLRHKRRLVVGKNAWGTTYSSATKLAKILIEGRLLTAV